ncbi:hypothetical protein HD597_010075 [Nonomuraea thailandensis]|uniref:3'-5' exoribonuclease Rv2179c-like domain-containing protein n=1 Tax=Nonomuraea thailandensis TaxID=1188745 RepID=A0A9X2K7X2_9ACTN|nr:3'-5' exoribonuclease [Nonomuraea thailandensis]MCP2363055.1 hypothetical protein [Nonomuraea thailandensis]
MKIFYDCEFLENGRTIELISIGIVTETGHEYYAVNSDAPWDTIREHRWLMDNVWPHLPLRGHKTGLTYTGTGPSGHEVKMTEPGVIDMRDIRVKPHWVIANEVREFILGVPDPELWAWYGAYDHVVLCQLWGRMIDLPKGVPMWTADLKQEAMRLGNPEMPKQAKGEHHALADARHNKVMAEYLDQLAKPTVRTENHSS